MSTNEYMNRIETITKACFMAHETNIGHPLFVTIFEYEKNNGVVEYGFLIKHRPFVDTDYVHPLDQIVLTYSERLSSTYAELKNVLHEEYGVNKSTTSSYLKESCK